MNGRGQIVAANLRGLRSVCGWSQVRAAQAAGVSVRGYQKAESGSTVPRMATLERLAAAFGVTTDDLVGRDDGFLFARMAELEMRVAKLERRWWRRLRARRK